MKINDVIDTDTAELVADRVRHDRASRVRSPTSRRASCPTRIDEDATSSPVPPVVAIMGHVDHGKTSPARRACAPPTSPPARLAGSPSTSAPIRSGWPTRAPRHLPGHAGPRSVQRHAGPRRQCHRYRHPGGGGGRRRHAPDDRGHSARSKAANAPMIVAVNKIDKPGADVRLKIVNELLQYEDHRREPGWRHPDHRGLGQGPAPTWTVCSKNILLQAEVHGPQGRPRPHSAEGIVIEAKLDKGRGPVARRFWSSAAPCGRATWSSPAPASVASAPCSTSAANS